MRCVWHTTYVLTCGNQCTAPAACVAQFTWAVDTACALRLCCGGTAASTARALLQVAGALQSLSLNSCAQLSPTLLSALAVNTQCAEHGTSYLLWDAVHAVHAAQRADGMH